MVAYIKVLNIWHRLRRMDHVREIKFQPLSIEFISLSTYFVKVINMAKVKMQSFKIIRINDSLPSLQEWRKIQCSQIKTFREYFTKKWYSIHLGDRWSLMYGLSGKTSYCQNSWSFEAARLDVIMTVSLRNLTGDTSRDLALRHPPT